MLRLTAGPDLATVGLYDPAGDRQPQPRAAGGARARFLAAVEMLEDVRQVLGRDPLAGVPYFHDHRRRTTDDRIWYWPNAGLVGGRRSLGGGHRDCYGAAGRGMPDR